ncbi:MAG: hypothetical protein QNL05_05205 [Gammaproteobacteria bacterium]|nr:hypothetical protein [Gammaproteobacteria bacterium]
MTKHYSTKNFFRQMPNGLLSRYFGARNCFTDFDFSAMKEGNPNDLFIAWLALPDHHSNIMDTEFREIFEMSCEKGFRAIIDEANWQLRKTPEVLASLIETLSALSNHYERAMITFLDHNILWRGATRFYHADTLPYWRKRKNLSHRQAAVDEVSIKQLADLIRNYFHSTEGRGNNCVVEPFRRGDLDYFFTYPEDYSQQSIEWVDGKFGRRPHNPAFEIIFVYSQKEGSLDLNYRGAYKAIEPLQGMFVTSILKLDELPPDPKDERVYNLNPLLNKDFNFSYTPGSGIENVAVKKIRFSSRIKKGDRITLEANASQNQNAIYELLNQVEEVLPLWMYNITQIELLASITVDNDKPPKQITIRVTHPNSCSLKYDELGLKLRDMLEASGIELKDAVENPEDHGPVKT